MKRKNYYGAECAKRLDLLMTELDIKAPALADLSHYSSQQIRNFRNFRRPMTVEAAHSIAPILGVRPEYLLCEDNCKTPEEFNEATQKRKISNLLNMEISSSITRLTHLIGENLENQNENSSISDNDLREFHQDISDYIQMRTEKWLRPRLKEKQEPEA